MESNLKGRRNCDKWKFCSEQIKHKSRLILFVRCWFLENSLAKTVLGNQNQEQNKWDWLGNLFEEPNA